jgi:hypothetical protein
VTDPAAGVVFQVAGGQVSALPGIPKGQPIWVQPTAIAISAGVVYVADTASHAVLSFAPGEQPSVYAGIVMLPKPAAGYTDSTGDRARFAAPCALAFGPDGALYVADFGNNCLRKVAVTGSLERPAPGPQQNQKGGGSAGGSSGGSS